MTATNKNEQAGKLLNEFEHPTYEQWREAAVKSLKGAPFDKKLLTKTYEGVTLQPVYNASSLESVRHLGSLPGEQPFVRGVYEASHCDWEVSQEIAYPSAQEVNQALKRDLQRGQTTINLVLDRAGQKGLDPDEAPDDAGVGGLSLLNVDELQASLEGIDMAAHPIHIWAGTSGLALTSMMASLPETDISKLTGCIGADPLGTAAVYGSLPRSCASLYKEMAETTKWAIANAPGLRTIMVASHPYHDAGADSVQELACAIATGVEYLKEMTGHGIAINDASPRIGFSFAVGSNFFMEMAKFRAAKLLWAQVVGAFGGNDDASKITIHARSSRWNRTISDPYVNILRGTTETFCAAISGVQSIHTSTFDEQINPADEFSRRVARNTQIVLKEESHLGHVTDPAGGSWFVEHLTDEVARLAWEQFQKIEEAGGMTDALSKGLIQTSIKETQAKRTKDLATRKSVLVGVNMYANLGEKDLEDRTVDLNKLQTTRTEAAKINRTGQPVLEKIDFNSVKTAVQKGASLGQISSALKDNGDLLKIEPLQFERGAAMFENLRAATKENRPKVFLANMGPIPQHKPRADFTRGFFEVGGFDVIGNDGFDTPQKAAQAAVNSGAKVTVICSTDPTYPELVPAFIEALGKNKNEISVVLAGYPKDQIEAHKQSGVDNFIHLRANNYEILSGLLKKIGVSL